MGDFKWTVNRFSKGEKGYVWHESQQFATKREAVATFGSRKAKSAIVKDGHSYNIEIEK